MKKKVPAKDEDEARSKPEPGELDRLEREMIIDNPPELCIVCKRELYGNVLICPNCKTGKYHQHCAEPLLQRNEACWICKESMIPKLIDRSYIKLEKDESRMTAMEKERSEELRGLSRRFVAGTPHIKASVIFDLEGYIITKAVAEDIKVEDLSGIITMMLAQSAAVAKNLGLESVSDFTITSENAKFTLKRARDVLVAILYDPRVKAGLMRFNLDRFIEDIDRITERFDKT